MWHSSASIPGLSGYPVNVGEWTRQMRRAAERRLQNSLKSVGGAEIYEMESLNFTLHLQKMVTLNEIVLLPQSKLPPNWDGHAKGPREVTITRT